MEEEGRGRSGRSEARATENINLVKDTPNNLVFKRLAVILGGNESSRSRYNRI